MSHPIHFNCPALCTGLFLLHKSLQGRPKWKFSSILAVLSFPTTALWLKCCISPNGDKSGRFISFHMLWSGPQCLQKYSQQNNPVQTVAWFHSWTIELKMRQDAEIEKPDLRVFPTSHLSNEYKLRKPPPTICRANPGYSFFNFMNQDQTLYHSFKVVKLEEKKEKDSKAATQLEFKALTSVNGWLFKDSCSQCLR